LFLTLGLSVMRRWLMRLFSIGIVRAKLPIPKVKLDALFQGQRCT
jgi:hypothetical protein